MRSLKLYLETSVWSHYFHDDVPERRAATRRFLDTVEGSRFDLFVSEVVLEEVNHAPAEKRDSMIALLRSSSPTILPYVSEIDTLASAYIAARALPESKRADALHVAYATVYEMTALISWNQRHLANLRRRMRVASVNLDQGYAKPLEMLTVWEVMFDEDDDA